MNRPKGATSLERKAGKEAGSPAGRSGTRVDSAVLGTARRAWQKTVGFLRRQPPNFKLMLVRRALHGLALNISAPYNSIYAVALGADPVQVGSLLTVGTAVSALAAVPTGWLIDRHGLKKVFVAGALLLVASAVGYALAPDFRLLYAAVALLYLGVRVSCISCTFIGARELINEERATARGLCRTVSSVLTVVTPAVAGWLVARLGGISVQGIRPLYFLQIPAFGIILLLLLLVLRESPRQSDPRSRPRLREFTTLLRTDPALIRFLIMIALMDLPWTMVQPYMPLFAHQFKNAGAMQLGGMAVAVSVAPLLLAIPLGRMADRYGRKMLLYLIAPVSHLSSFLLIGASGPTMLYLAGLSFGFHSIAIALATAMASELVPRDYLGRWIGLLGLGRGLISIPAPLFAGLIWEHLGPRQVFIFAVLLDMLVRLPLLASVRETLHAPVPRAEEA